jgi:oligopeptide transport system substrate-binding protein
MASIALNYKNPWILNYRVSEDKGTLDWNYGEVNQDIIDQIMEGLTAVDENGSLKLIGAKKIKQKNNTYSFTLNEKIFWSDGKKVCAQDYVNAWNRILEKKIVSPYAHYFNEIKKIEAKNCNTFIVTLNAPIAYFPYLVSHWVFFPMRLDKKLDGTVVNGPYMIREWKKNEFVEMVKNPYYQDFQGRADILRAFFIQSDDTALRLFENKKLDWIRDLPFLELKKLSKKKNFKTFDTLVMYFLVLNKNLPRTLRCEIIKNFNQNEIPKVLSGLEKPLKNFSPFLADFDYGIKSKVNRKSVGVRAGVATSVGAGATGDVGEGVDAGTDAGGSVSAGVGAATSEGKGTYEGAGADIGAGVDIDTRARVDEGHKNFSAKNKTINLEFYNKDIHQPLMEWVQMELKKITKLNVKLSKLENKVYWQKLGQNPADIFLSGITANYFHPHAFYREFLSNSSSNWVRYSSSAYDELVNKIALLKTNDKNLKNLSAQIESILLEKDCIVLPLYQRRTSAMIQENIKNLFITPLSRIYLKNLKK